MIDRSDLVGLIQDLIYENLCVAIVRGWWQVCNRIDVSVEYYHSWGVCTAVPRGAGSVNWGLSK